MTPIKKLLFPLILVFIIFNAIFIAGKHFFEQRGIDREVLIIANLLFFVVSLLVFMMQRKGLQTTNPHAFVRSVMGGMLVKMVITLAAVVIYATMSGDSFNKPAVFISLGLYIIYLVVEVAIISKLNKQKNA